MFALSGGEGDNFQLPDAFFNTALQMKDVVIEVVVNLVWAVAFVLICFEERSNGFPLVLCLLNLADAHINDATRFDTS